MKPMNYRVDYYYQRQGLGSRTRTQLTGSVGQHLEGATTENAISFHLQKQHPGCEIVLMSVEWK